MLKTSTLTKNNVKGVEIIKFEIIFLHVKTFYNEKLDEGMSSEKLGWKHESIFHGHESNKHKKPKEIKK